jgi:hypothetical protein
MRAIAIKIKEVFREMTGHLMLYFPSKICQIKELPDSYTTGMCNYVYF